MRELCVVPEQIMTLMNCLFPKQTWLSISGLNVKVFSLTHATGPLQICKEFLHIIVTQGSGLMGTPSPCVHDH